MKSKEATFTLLALQYMEVMSSIPPGTRKLMKKDGKKEGRNAVWAFFLPTDNFFINYSVVTKSIVETKRQKSSNKLPTTNGMAIKISK
jgi:hypothetical protein